MTSITSFTCELTAQYREQLLSLCSFRVLDYLYLLRIINIDVHCMILTDGCKMKSCNGVSFL